MRPSDVRVRANCRALKRPEDPGMATEMNPSLPRMRRHFLALMRLQGPSSANILARDCLRWGGSSRVCLTVLTIQPRSSLRVDQLPSPFFIFLRDTASFRWSWETSGLDRTASMECRRCRHRVPMRLGPPCPSWMKSSTKTSVWPTGRLKHLLEAGARSLVRDVMGGGPPRARSAWESSRLRGCGRSERERSSWMADPASSRWGGA